MRVVSGPERSGVQIDPTALVSPGCNLEEGVVVGPYSIIGASVELGPGTRVGSHVVIEGNTRIGAQCRISHGAVIGTDPQDLKFKGEESRLRIGDRNTIREFVTVNVATEAGGETVIGSDNLIMAYVHIAHNCIIGNHVILANAVNLGGHVSVCDHAIIGGLTPVHQFVRIGRHAFVGGGSRVAQDVPPYLRAAGNPLLISGLNSVGLVRRGFSPEARSTLKKLYRLFFRSGLNVSQAVERAERDLPETEEVRAFIDFVKSSERGITLRCSAKGG